MRVSVIAAQAAEHLTTGLPFHSLLMLLVGFAVLVVVPYLLRHWSALREKLERERGCDTLRSDMLDST